MNEKVALLSHLLSKSRDSRSNRLIDSNEHNSSPLVKRFFGDRAKNSLFYKLFVVAAPLSFLLVPLVVQASFFTFIASFFEKAATPSGAVTSSLNSQRMALLEPATNLNPNPPRGGGDVTLADSVALVPEAGPAGSAADFEEVTSQSSQISVYTVREGDTLSEIAEMFDVTVNTIAWANDIQDRVIHPGQELVILPITGVRHEVQDGESLATIADTYEGDVEEIANYNELAVNASLTAGEVIIVPDGVIASPSPSSSGSTVPVSVVSTVSVADSYFVRPIANAVKTQGIHGYNGVDLAGPHGEPIIAAAAGTVIVARAGGWNGGYGSYVVIKHNNGTQTLYAHLDDVIVSQGQVVSQRQIIGHEGMTGKSTGPHLHFEVRGAANPF